VIVLPQPPPSEKVGTKRAAVSTLEIDVGDLRARSVEFTTTELVVTLADGRRIATPL
jgi:hypothetical protein